MFPEEFEERSSRCFGSVRAQNSIIQLMNPRIILWLVLLAALPIVSGFAKGWNGDQSTSAAAMYRGACVACHGTRAELRFDATKLEEKLVRTILKGRKTEIPPDMPSFADKGVSQEQAKALVAYMKSLRQ